VTIVMNVQCVLQMAVSHAHNADIISEKHQAGIPNLLVKDCVLAYLLRKW